MSRPRKPTKVLELNGAFERNPQRRKAREHEPQPTGPLGDPPAHLDEAQQARWGEIAGWAPWLTETDRPLVESTCRLWMRIRSADAKSMEYAMFTANLSKLGMTPVDRSKVQMPRARDQKKKTLLA